MIFALACSLVTLLVAAGTAVPNTKDKMTYYPKPRSSMLKSLSASDEYQTKPLSRSTLSVDQSTIWLVTWYYSYSPNICSSDVIMKTGIPSGQCLAYSDATYGSYDCNNYYSNGYCYYTAYWDSTCTYPNGSSSQVYLGMCGLGDASSDGYLADNGLDYLSQMLTIETGFPYPLPGDSTIFSTYSSTTCDPSTMTSYTQAYANTCYSQYDGTYYTSSKYANPYSYTYYTYGCNNNNGYNTNYYPPGVCQVNYNTWPYTSAMMTMNQLPPPPTPAGPVVNTATVVGAAVGGFAALALLDTMLYLFAPTAASQTDDYMTETQKTGEF